MIDTPKESRRRLLARMRQGAQDAVRRAVTGVRKLAPTTLMAALCAGAFAPVVAAALGAGAVSAAAIGVAGGVGGNLLTEAVTKVVSRLRGEDPEREVTIEEIEAALTEHFTEALDAGTENTEGLRQSIADLMRHLEFSEDETRALIAHGDETTRREITAGFVGQDAHLTAFGIALDTAVNAAEKLAATVGADFAGREAERDRHGVLVARVEDLWDRVQDLLHTAGVPRQTGARWTGPPYVGLTPFRDDEAAIFHGRTTLINQLLKREELTPSGAGILVVTGASGAGKSSLLRAGLIPAFRRGESPVPGSRHWPRMVITPGSDPMKALAVKLAGLTGGDAIALRSSLREHPEQMGTAIRQAVDAVIPSDPTARMLLVIDQCEELFTLTGENDRQAFITAIDALRHDLDGPPAIIIMSVRGDFFDRCAAHPELTPVLNDHTIVIGPMTGDELRQAITAPAAAANLEFDDEHLVGDVLADLHNPNTPSQYRVAALPLLSQTMRALWDERSGNVLTRRAYAAMGGVSNAVTSWAERVYGDLDTDSAEAAKALFRQLVDVSTERVARRPAHLSELDDAGEATTRAISAFIAARLLVIERETVSIAHDCLLEFWPRLQQWVSEQRTSLAIYQRLNDEAANWVAKDRNRSFLYRGTRLREVEGERNREWSERPDRYLTPSPEVIEFLSRSRQADKRWTWIRNGTVAVVAVLLAAASIGFVVATRANGQITAQRNEALSKQLARTSQDVTNDGALSQLLAAAAWKIDGTNEAWDAMTDAYGNPADGVLTGGHRAQVTAMTYSRDGRYLATGADDGTLAIWDTPTRQPTSEILFAGRSVDALAISPDSAFVAVVAYGEIVIWDVANAREVKRFMAVDDSAHSNTIAYSPDGRMLAVGLGEPSRKDSPPGRVLVWETTSYEKIGDLSRDEEVTSVMFHPARQAIFIGDFTGTITVNVIASGEEIWRRTEPPGREIESMVARNDDPLNAVAVCSMQCELWDMKQDGAITRLTNYATTTAVFSGDGSLVAVGVEDGIDIWDSTEHVPVATITHVDSPTMIAFSPDGGTIAAAAGSNVSLWRVDHTATTTTLEGRNLSSLRDLRFTADGTHIICATKYGYVEWDATSGSVTSEDRSSSPLPVNTAISSDGSRAALVLAQDRTIIDILNIVSGEKVTSINVFDQPLPRTVVASMTTVLSPNGGVLVAGYGYQVPEQEQPDTKVRLFDTSSGNLLRTLPGFDTAALHHAVFNPDGSILATVDALGVIRLWSVATGDELATFEPSDRLIFDVEYSPDGNTLAIGAGDGFTLWNTVTEASVDITIGKDNGAMATAFSPDGRYLAAATGHLSIIWDLVTGARAAELPGGSLVENVITFDRQGRSLVALRDGLMHVTDTSFLVDPYTAICAKAGRDLTDDEWKQYLGGLSRDDINLCS